MDGLEDDRVLTAMAARLVAKSTEPNRVARCGADEFATLSLDSGSSLRGM